MKYQPLPSVRRNHTWVLPHSFSPPRPLKPCTLHFQDTSVRAGLIPSARQPPAACGYHMGRAGSREWPAAERSPLLMHTDPGSCSTTRPPLGGPCTARLT